MCKGIWKYPKVGILHFFEAVNSDVEEVEVGLGESWLGMKPILLEHSNPSISRVQFLPTGCTDQGIIAAIQCIHFADIPQ